MRNITVTVDDRTHRAARIRAAELDTSVSALVRNYLRALADNQVEMVKPDGKDSKKTRTENRERKLGDAIANIRMSSPEFSAADNLSRDSLYNQARTKSGSID